MTREKETLIEIFTNPLVVWDEFTGEMAYGAIAQIRKTNQGPSAKLGPPFNGERPGWFYLNDLLKNGRISTGGFTILLNDAWKNEERHLRDAHRPRAVWPNEQRFEKERSLLGLSKDGALNSDKVISAFKEKAKQGHPDTGGTGRVDMDALVRAKDALLGAIRKVG